MYECDKGWYPLIEKYKEMILRVEPKTHFTQIKEKWAGLRIYVAFDEGAKNTDIVDILCEAAEKESYSTCEVCGHNDLGWMKNKVKVRQGSWFRTLCDEHAKELGYEEKETSKTP